MNGDPTLSKTEPDDWSLGRENYNIYCLPCHGGTGKGDGMVGTRWSYPLPNFHDDLYQRGGDRGQDGLIFDAIRNGVANPGGQWELKMPSYASKVSVEESWAIVAYIRTLQAVESGTLEDLPPSARSRLAGELGAIRNTTASAGADDKKGGES